MLSRGEGYLVTVWEHEPGGPSGGHRGIVGTNKGLRWRYYSSWSYYNLRTKCNVASLEIL